MSKSLQGTKFEKLREKIMGYNQEKRNSNILLLQSKTDRSVFEIYIKNELSKEN